MDPHRCVDPDLPLRVEVPGLKENRSVSKFINLDAKQESVLGLSLTMHKDFNYVETFDEEYSKKTQGEK